MGRLVGMIMVMILVTEYLAAAGNHDYNSNIEDDADVVPSMPPSFSSTTATYDFRFRVPKSLRNKAHGILKALKQKGIRCADSKRHDLSPDVFKLSAIYGLCGRQCCMVLEKTSCSKSMIVLLAVLIP